MLGCNGCLSPGGMACGVFERVPATNLQASILGCGVSVCGDFSSLRALRVGGGVLAHDTASQVHSKT